ncbi:MAG: vWA domain-containing protein [Planctomycetaceae bacterium]|nr:VWA domain-containing protein [Planctomycetaceae bacterium]
MPFVHPIIFWIGAACVSAPIIIHLLNRRRFRLRHWAAMQFLLDSLRRNRRRLRIEEMILLAMRCLAVLLLALAIARFTGCAATSVLPGMSGPRSTVYILDNSYSMLQKSAALSLFENARHDLAERIRRTSRSEKVAVLMGAGDDGQAPLFDLNYVAEPVSLAARLESLDASDGRLALATALGRAGALLANEAGARQVVVLTDCRKIDLTAPAAQSPLQKAFAALRKSGVNVEVLDYGQESRKNLTIESIELLDRFAVANVPFNVAVTVRNNGTTNIENVALTPRMVLPGQGDRTVVLPVQVIASLESGQSTRVIFEAASRSPGSAVVTVEAAGDDLQADNRAHLALDIRKVTRVLIVDGNTDPTDRTESESFFLSKVLDPRGDGAFGVRAEVISSDTLGGANFADYDAVALLDVADFPSSVETGPATRPAVVYPQLKALEEYVRGGGGLIIFTGGHINLDFYNGPFYAGGVGLLPYRVGPHKGRPDQSDTYVRLAPSSIANHNIMQAFTRFAAEGSDVTSLVRFFAFTPAEEPHGVVLPPDIKAPQVLAAFADPQNSPAVITRRFGLGEVVLFCTTASKRWNDWPSDEVGTYAVIAHETVKFVARSASQNLTARVGHPIDYTLAADLLDAQATLKTPRFPADDLVTLVARRQGAAAGHLSYAATDGAGIYWLELVSPDRSIKKVLFARNIDPAEGDLACGGRTALEAALGSDDFAYAAKAAGGNEPLAAAAAKKEYWLLAALAALVLLAGETFLGQKFGHYAGRKAAAERQP